MGKLQYGSGSIRVEMSDTLERLVRAAQQNVAPGILEAIEESVTRVEAEATAKWPVKTGASRDGLEANTVIDSDGRIRGSVTNNVKHARYVKSAKNGLGGKSAFVELLRKPMHAEAKRLATELPPVIVEGLKK